MQETMQLYQVHAVAYLPIKNGFPRGSLFAHRTVVRPLHRYLVLPVKQLQSPSESKQKLWFEDYSHDYKEKGNVRITFIILFCT